MGWSDSECEIICLVCKALHVRTEGVMLDTKLDFHVHYQTFINEAHKMLGFVNRHSKTIEDIHCLKSLYLSFLQSVLEYCSVLW